MSTACGPLARWAFAKTQYARIIDQIQQLQDRPETLENDAKSAEQRAIEVNVNLGRSEKSIRVVRDEHCHPHPASWKAEA